MQICPARQSGLPSGSVNPKAAPRALAAWLDPPLERIADGWLRLAVFCVGCALLIARRPDAVLAAQFWAEDGRYWYAEAYALGPLWAAVTPHDGYFQTVSRSAAALALLVPLAA